MRRLLCNALRVVVFAGVVAPITYQALDRDVPYQRSQGEMIPPNPHPLDWVEVRWHGRVVRDCPGMVERKIIDSTRHVFTLEATPATYYQAVNAEGLIRKFQLPAGLAPGGARYIAITKFWCNWTQRILPITVDRPPVDFIVAGDSK